MNCKWPLEKGVSFSTRAHLQDDLFLNEGLQRAFQVSEANIFERTPFRNHVQNDELSTISGMSKHDLHTVMACRSFIDNDLFNAFGIAPCNDTGTTTQTCCVRGDVCLSDSICHFMHSLDNVSGYYIIGGCTDEVYSDPACSRHCGRSLTRLL